MSRTNITSPELVGRVHAAYFAAGSGAVITNTLGANKYVLARHGHAEKVGEINLAAAQIARKAAGENKYVLGDIGSCGDFLEPLGAVKADELKTTFAVQAKGLEDGGVDGFIIETMTAIEEVQAAIEAVKSVSRLPIFAGLAYDAAGDGFKTMMGVDPAGAVKRLGDSGISAIGFNCGTLTMAEYIRLARDCGAALKGSELVLLAEANAGRPELVDGRAVYSLLPGDFADSCAEIFAAGATIVGGCCGTGPAHIRAMVERLGK